MLSLLFAIAVAAAPFDPGAWTWSAPIDAAAAPGFVRVVITPEMMAQSQQGLRDLRVLDTSNNLVPHVLHMPRTEPVERLEWVPAQLLNPVHTPGSHSQVTLDFGEPRQKTLLRVNMNGNNYRRRAIVEGSNDGRDWQQLGDNAWLFAIPGTRVEANQIQLPLNNFRYLRLTVYNMESENTRIDITTVQAALRAVLPGSTLVPVPVLTLTGPLRDEKDMATAFYELDLQYPNLPIQKVDVVFSEPHFYMPYSLYGRNSLQNEVTVSTENGEKREKAETPWKLVSTGVFYRIVHEGRVGEDLSIEHAQAPYRYLQLRLHEGDNPSLRLEKVTVQRRAVWLVFECAPETQYKLVGGNPAADMPDFALARSMPGIAQKELPQVTTGPITIKPPTVPFARRYQVLIWVGLFAAATLMILIILMNLPKLRGVED